VIPALPLSEEEKQRFPNIDPERLRPMEEWLRAPEADPMLRWRLLQRGMWVNGVDNLYDYFVSMLDYELSSVAGRISCPTLLTAAEGDPIAAGAPKLLEAIDVPKRLVRSPLRRGRAATAKARRVFSTTSASSTGSTRYWRLCGDTPYLRLKLFSVTPIPGCVKFYRVA
jgi:hypothetical protein